LKGHKDSSGKFHPHGSSSGLTSDQILSRNDWRKIVASQPSIVKDQNQMRKYFPKIDRPSGFAFSDLDHYTNARDRLDKKLLKLAKKHKYVPEGYTAYQAFHDHPSG